MTQETKKSYNPFKMWGSWIGFGIGLLGTASYVITPYILPDPVQYLHNGNMIMAVSLALLNLLGRSGGMLQMTNPLMLVAQWPFLPIIILTPVFDFLYGWGIHSLFRKSSS